MKKNKKDMKGKEIEVLHKKHFPMYDGGISFSFATLERTDYFNLDATCANWTSDLFEMMKRVSDIPMIDLIQNKYKTYRVHPHTDANPPSPLPEGIELKDFYQIRISLSKGGIHGIFNDNVFYVIWLDPFHNLYPDENHGGLKKITPPNTCCMERELELQEMSQEIEKLKSENESYRELFGKT